MMFTAVICQVPPGLVMAHALTFAAIYLFVDGANQWLSIRY